MTTKSVFLFDSEVHGPFSRPQAVDALNMTYGGTDYSKVWEHLGLNPTATSVMIITDGFGLDLEKAPKYVEVVQIPADFGLGNNKT